MIISELNLTLGDKTALRLIEDATNRGVTVDKAVSDAVDLAYGKSNKEPTQTKEGGK